MVRTLVAISVGAVLLSACAEEQAAPPSQQQRLQAASQGLCDAQVAASEGQVGRAGRIFDAETHDYLHELAAMLQDVDPETAAALLEAKERVESSLGDGSDPAGAQELLSRLQRALGDAALAASLRSPLCREGAA